LGWRSPNLLRLDRLPFAPLVLAWQFREVTAWLTLNRASGSEQQRAARAAEDAQRFIEVRAKE
jgi:hypothetical protein